MKQLEKQLEGLYTKIAIKDCVKALEENTSADAYESSAGMFVLNNNEVVQVKVIVTRKEDDFIGELELTEHNTLNK